MSYDWARQVKFSPIPASSFGHSQHLSASSLFGILSSASTSTGIMLEVIFPRSFVSTVGSILVLSSNNFSIWYFDVSSDDDGGDLIHIMMVI